MPEAFKVITVFIVSAVISMAVVRLGKWVKRYEADSAGY
jgi:hypothetical protein